MRAWLLNVVYVIVVLTVAPVLLWRAVRQGKYRTGWDQKLWGRVPPRSGQRTCIWLHAVSVGEVLQLQGVVKGLLARLPDCEIVISTTTTTGHDVATRKFPDCQVIYFPLDFSWSVARALDRIRPDLIGLVELELWPNFLQAAARREIPVTLVNGRISRRSYVNYLWIRGLMRGMLGQLQSVLVQTEEYALRFLDLGAPPERIVVTGSIKFDGVETNRRNPRTQELRGFFGLQSDERVFIAGSTQAPEERLAISTYLELQPLFPDLRLLLVPRHKERFDEVAQLVTEEFGLPLVRRGQPAKEIPTEVGMAPRTSDPASLACLPFSDQAPVLLLDTLGELAACWGLADVAFVGGSLTSRGGQNMIEPAAYGAAVLFGPNTQNFRDVTSLLLGDEAARVVRNGDELTTAVREYLQDRGAAARQGVRAQTLVLAQQGATQRTLDQLMTDLADARSRRTRERLRIAG